MQETLATALSIGLYIFLLLFALAMGVCSFYVFFCTINADRIERSRFYKESRAKWEDDNNVNEED